MANLPVVDQGRTVALPRWWSVLMALPAALALALLPLPYAAVAIVGLFVLVMVIVDPVWGLYASILSIPVQEMITLPAGLTVTQVVVALAAGSWVLKVLAHPDRTLGLRYQWPWLLFLGWQLLAVVMTPYSLAAGFQQWARWVAAWLAFVLVLGTVTNRRRMWGLVIVLLMAPGFSALLGTLQFLNATGNASFLIAGGRFARATATFGKPNSYAGYMNMAWPLGLMLGIYWFQRWHALRRLLAASRVFPASVRRMTEPFHHLRGQVSDAAWTGAGERRRRCVDPVWVIRIVFTRRVARRDCGWYGAGAVGGTALSTYRQWYVDPGAARRCHRRVQCVATCGCRSYRGHNQ